MAQFAKAIAAHYHFAYHEYADLHQFSREHPEEFWHFFVSYHNIQGDFPPTCTDIITDKETMRGGQFFPTAQINFAENLLNHAEQRNKDVALTFKSHVITQTLTWQELSDRVSLLQQALKKQGFGVGDVAAGFLPNAPIAVIAMLAVTSLGGVWTSCSPDFGVDGVLDRFGQSTPKILFATDGYYYKGKWQEILAKIVEFTATITSIEAMIIEPFPAEQMRDQRGGGFAQEYDLNMPKAGFLDDFIADYTPQPLEFTRLKFNDPLFIMYSSGTTGVPKCIIHGIGGSLLNFVKEHRLHSDIRPGDGVFYYTTCGWMMWNWLVATLASGARLLLYDESPFHPEPDSLFAYMQAQQARFMGVSAKYIDALAKNAVNVMQNYDLSTLDFIGSTGSVLSPESFEYIYQYVKSDVFVSSLSGGTDIIGCFVMGVPTRSVYSGEIVGAALGMAIEVLRSDGTKALTGEKGELVCAQPFPNMPIGFFGDTDHSKYHQTYFARFPNKWHQGDFIATTPNKGFIIYGRSDATLNPGGVRIGTSEIYRAVEAMPFIVETICVGQDWLGDVRIILFVILQKEYDLTEALIAEIKQTIKTRCTPRHVPAKIIQITEIPRTRSGKITELAVRDIVNGNQPQNLSALANPESLKAYQQAYRLYLMDHCD